MSKHNKSYRIRTSVGVDNHYINFNMNQSYNKFEILSLEINQDNEGNYYVVAQGDNNETMDKKVLEEQITGKCLFKIKYLGYPTLVVRSLFE